jgi:hypothetical protein
MRGYWRRLWSTQTGIFLALWFLLLLGGRESLFRDPGTFWHTRLGEMMLDAGPVRGDPFSFTGGSRATWVPTQWLGECLMALLFRLGGWDVLQLAAVTVLASLYAWLAHRLLVSGMHWAPAAVVTALALAAGSSNFHVRPHIATMALFAATFVFLADFETARIGLRRLFWLVPLFTLWSNLHGGMLGGLLTLGLVVTGWAAARLIGWPAPLRSWSQLVPLVLLVLACAGSAFINPYGGRLPVEWLDILGQKHLSEVLQEHAPLDPTRLEGMFTLLLAAVYGVVVVAACVRRRPHVSWLLPLVWFYLACTRVRHASLFGIAASLALADMLPETGLAEHLALRGSDLFDVSRGRVARAPGLLSLVLPVAVVVGALTLKASGVAVPVVGAGWARLNADVCPREQADLLRRYPDGTPLFNELNFGGCLIYFSPNMRVFADDRAELYGEDFLLDYDRAARDPSRAEEFLRRFRYQLALTRTDSAFDAYFRRRDGGWAVVLETETATLYRRE